MASAGYLGGDVALVPRWADRWRRRASLGVAAVASGVLPYSPLPYLRRGSSRTIVLTAFHGRGFRGNPRAIFERLVGDAAVDAVWLATDPRVVEEVRARFGERRAALAHSRAGVLALARAGAIVLSHGTSDLPLLHLSRRAIVLQSWHGLPTKTGELQEDPPLVERLKIRRRWLAVDWMLSSSPLVSSIYAARFGLPRARMLELGYPAYDRLVRPEPLDLRALLPEAPPFERVVVYAPTFRKRAATRWFPFADYDPAALAAFLERERAIVVLRPHPNDRADAARACAVSPRLVLVDDRRMEDAMPLVARADLVVTDYSGIFLEGLLADVPCMFVPYDLHEYERGIPWDYERNTPGPKVRSFAEMVSAMGLSLRDRAAFAGERVRVRDAFFTHTDGRATDRVVQWLVDSVARNEGRRA